MGSKDTVKYDFTVYAGHSEARATKRNIGVSANRAVMHQEIDLTTHSRNGGEEISSRRTKNDHRGRHGNREKHGGGTCGWPLCNGVIGLETVLDTVKRDEGPMEMGRGEARDGGGHMKFAKAIEDFCLSGLIKIITHERSLNFIILL